jgi:hypothetical protein
VTRGLALALTVGAIFAALAASFPLRDPDLFWHLASGRWMVEHGAVLSTDVFSSTIRGQPVPVHQWLGQLALWAAFAAGSWWGVAALRILAVFALATLVSWSAIARASRPALGVVAAFPALALARVEWGDRPQLLGLVAFAAFLPLATAARAGDRRAQVALVPLLAVWANLHGGFVVGVALLAALGVEAALFARPLPWSFLVAAVAAALATLANPLGPGVYASPEWHFTNPPRFIQEWGLPDVTTIDGLLYATTLLATLALAMRVPSGRTSDVAILVPLAFLSLSALRQMPLFALASAPFVAERLSALLPRLAPRVPVRQPWAIALPLVGVVLVASLALAPRGPDLAGYPVGALASLRERDGAVLNDYDWGGFLIWYAPEHPVFIDGRLVPYIGLVLDEYREAIGAHRAWRSVLDERGIDLVLVRPASALAVRLTDAGWRTAYRDDDTVLLSRP